MVIAEGVRVCSSSCEGCDSREERRSVKCKM